MIPKIIRDGYCPIIEYENSLYDGETRAYSFYNLIRSLCWNLGRSFNLKSWNNL